jgi:hypothetical protein
LISEPSARAMPKGTSPCRIRSRSASEKENWKPFVHCEFFGSHDSGDVGVQVLHSEVRYITRMLFMKAAKCRHFHTPCMSRNSYTAFCAFRCQIKKSPLVVSCSMSKANGDGNRQGKLNRASEMQKTKIHLSTPKRHSGSLISTTISGSCFVVLLRGWLVTVVTKISFPITIRAHTQQGRIKLIKITRRNN